MAGVEGLEPPHARIKPLPYQLGDTPMIIFRRLRLRPAPRLVTQCHHFGGTSFAIDRASLSERHSKERAT